MSGEVRSGHLARRGTEQAICGAPIGTKAVRTIGKAEFVRRVALVWPDPLIAGGGTPDETCEACVERFIGMILDSEEKRF